MMFCIKFENCQKNEEYDPLDLLPDQVLASNMRDICYAALVKDIVENNRASQRLKSRFFYMVCFTFVIICVGGILTIFNISRKPDLQIADVAVVISALSGVLGSIIVLPTTIAKHLFPEDSEKERFSFIKGNRESDATLNESHDRPEQDF